MVVFLETSPSSFENTKLCLLAKSSNTFKQQQSAGDVAFWDNSLCFYRHSYL